MNNILKTIIEQKQFELTQLQRKFNANQALKDIAVLNAPKSFIAALRNKQGQGKPGVIAEVKKASPSQGIIRADFEPLQIAEIYQQAGAACLSVLTDEKFFQGCNSYLTEIAAKIPLPVLRKDFIIDPLQIYQARLIGSDCILLIAACLEPNQLIDYTQLAHELQLQVLIEVHNFKELEPALAASSGLIGINNRDLTTFETQLNTTLEIAKEIPQDRLIISESGIHTREDVQYLQKAGVHYFLVGESLMRAPDINTKFSELFDI